MLKRQILSTILGLSLATLGACAADGSLDADAIGVAQQAITDVDHAPVERQSIGNCWLYSQASWVESLSLQADPDSDLDISQSYWTYWHWFDQVTNSFPPQKIQTGGFQFTSHSIVRERGLMAESAFVSEDSLQEMSARQKTALTRINEALEQGEFNNVDGEHVRQIFDEAWELSPEVRAQLDQVFGVDGAQTLRQSPNLVGTEIQDPATMAVQYTQATGPDSELVDGTLLDAISAWQEVRYPFDQAGRRRFLKRVQRALHDKQPVVITWNVDFNALENAPGPLQGSFNMATLEAAGRPGHQGGHMTVLEDYQAETTEFGTLEAGVTLDASNPDDAEKLTAALNDSTEITFLRTKNSWGANRPDREFAPGFPGYHDLHMDYLNGPIPFCPDAVDPTNETCDGEATPLRSVMLPPGY